MKLRLSDRSCVRCLSKWGIQARLALRVVFWAGLGGIAATRGQEANQAALASEVTNRAGVLHFLDGSILHGELSGINTERGVEWKHPAAKRLIEFKPDNVGWVRFERIAALPQQTPAFCRFRFQNGDEVFGNLEQLRDEKLQLGTWFGGSLHAPQNALKSVSFSTNGFKIYYEGPTGTEGWNIGRPPKSWQYRDGAFYSQGGEILGRDLNLSRSCKLEFDLSWTTASFNLTLSMFTDSIDRFDYGASSYIFNFGPGMMSVQRVQAGGGVVLLGQASIPDMLRDNKVRMELRANRDEGLVAVQVDGQLIQRWKDSIPLQAKGSSVIFLSHMDGPSLKIGNIKVSEWDGKFEPENEGAVREDNVFLINRDKVSGKVKNIVDGKLLIETSLNNTPLTIPINRVTHIFFSSPQSAIEAPEPWAVRARFSGGETLAFHLQKWSGAEMAGVSKNFGAMKFKPEAVRELEFNLNKSKSGLDGSPAAVEDDWDLKDP